MNMSSHLLLWNHAFIKIIDVRHANLEQGEVLPNYSLPTSAFLYTVRGSATISIDHHIHMVDRFYIFHGGKDSRVHIAAKEWFEYYWILYQAILPLPSRQDIIRLWENNNSFQSQYTFVPSHPLSLYSSVEQMHQQWQRSDEWERLHVKALLYQFIAELFRQMQLQEVEPVKPDLTAQAIRYIQENYQKPISLDTIAGEFECSVGYLSKLFKKHMNTSPIHYLGEVRIHHAKKLLLQTGATLQEIAEHTGYPDGYSLSRSFKRYEGIPPVQYRDRLQKHGADEELLRHRRKYAILPPKLRRYNDSDIENHYQLKGDEPFTMYRNMKVTAMTFVLCLTLLMSACSGAQNTTTGNSQSSVNRVEAQGNNNASEQPAPTAATRIVSTPKGDVEIPAEPQRVASDQYMGHLLKLGIVPIGVREGMLDEGWIEKSNISPDVIAQIESLGAFPMNLEKLTTLEPDLIIGSIEDNIEQYQKIGTTVFIPYWEGLSTADPLEKFRRVSDIFGKRQEADAWIAEYEAKAEQARQQIKGIIKDGETVSVVQIGSKALYVLAAKGGNYGSPTIYQMLQLPPTEQAKQMGEGFDNVSLELLPEYMGDHAFVYVNSKADADEIMNSAVWKNSKAVKNGNVYMYGEFGDEFVMEDPFSLEQQLDTITEILLAKKK
ncbi:HTH-type transcriptional activator RhaR [Paenibacillus plantiphilus]|uniref:HTH-type transcriptional activator RhaR n=1 Tax=Paenibacillus plantiphilus TaxID=2905650 RepID=A0ABM9CJ71_9BACL|nr:AraC family transcriptional regulator [Paenibacillus plantiphilus]CAH1215907.1 HTH-type transcriptional activator RhaR [Paenibacillus plantiphilus]